MRQHTLNFLLNYFYSSGKLHNGETQLGCNHCLSRVWLIMYNWYVNIWKWHTNRPLNIPIWYINSFVIMIQLSLISIAFCFYFFIADQTAQVGQPMVFNWARHFGQSGQQQRNTATVAALTNQHEHLYLFVATVLFHKFASTTVPRVHVLCFVLLQLPYNVLMPQAVFVCCCLEYPTCLANVIRWARQLG